MGDDSGLPGYIWTTPYTSAFGYRVIDVAAWHRSKMPIQ
jgi:hypothetical protein